MFKAISDVTKMTAISSGFIQGLRAATPDLKAFADLTRVHTPDFAAFGALQKSIDSATFPILSLDFFKKADFAGVANLHERIGSITRSRESTPPPFVREKLQQIAEIGHTEDVDDIEANFQHIEKSIIDRIKQTPALRISFEGWLNLLLTLFVFLYSTISSERFQTHLDDRIDSIERLDNRILDAQKHIYQALAQHLADSRTGQDVYIVQRKVETKSRPTMKSQTNGSLMPGEIVMLEDRRGKWIRVTYFDYDDATIVTGWVLKKYLKMMRH
jgi:hypothetical protein